MKTYLMHRVVRRNGHINIGKTFLMLTLLALITFIFCPTNSLAQVPTCPDYCQQGYKLFYLGSGTDSLCFSTPSGAATKVCMELNLIYAGGGNCSKTATVTVGIYKWGTDTSAGVPNCTSPLSYSFTAQYGYQTGSCPNGNDVQCCCLAPYKDYYIKVLSNGTNYSPCFASQSYIKICIDCNSSSCEVLPKQKERLYGSLR